MKDIHIIRCVLLTAILHLLAGAPGRLSAQLESSRLPSSQLPNSPIGEVAFDQPFKLMVGGATLDVGLQGGAMPYLYDFDEDGCLDLLVGESYMGRLRIYQGTPTMPFSFRDYRLFDEFSPNPRVPANPFTPVVIDVDQDGMDDIVTPSWHGNITWFRKTGPLAYAAGELIKNVQGTEIDIEWTLSVAAADWDADNRVDLLVTTTPDREGRKLFLLRNAGQDGEPRFENAVPIQLGDATLFAESRQLYVVTADWNKDGQFDILISNGSKTVYLFINQGQASFGQPIELPVIPAGHALNGIGSFCLADVDGDGQKDFLVGGDGDRFNKKFAESDLAKLETAKTAYQAALSKWGRVFRSYANIREKQDAPALLNTLRGQVVSENQRQLRLHEEIVALQMEEQQHSYVWLIRISR